MQDKKINSRIYRGEDLKNEIVLFTDGEKNIEVQVSPDKETVWLTQKQMEELFDVKHATISEHINNILSSGELDETSVGFSDKSSGGRKPKIYNLDMILSVGYRVNSKRGIAFRRWANNVLKQYIMKGYAINEKRLAALNKTVEIQSKIIANTLEIEEAEVLRAVKLYTDALVLLDQYDHQSLSKPEGNKPVYRITYEDCRNMINHMEDSFSSDVFGVEKETGKVEGILAAVYQDVFGGEVYPSLEEKAANLLYFMIKDHPFADGCKRIAASLFLEFLDKNDALIRDGQKVISDGALVAITLMIAESNPEEKDIMTTLVMNLLKM
ncbi:RhuM family protein [Butyrivibrio fibrisolvens]|uniref:RhuM family protein n=1 Tax=Butyrivibrio fibrisolvens TaxID=831 RepID=UPI002F4213C8